MAGDELMLKLMEKVRKIKFKSKVLKNIQYSVLHKVTEPDVRQGGTLSGGAVQDCRDEDDGQVDFSSPVRVIRQYL